MGAPYSPSVVVGIDGSRAALDAALWAVDEAVSRDIPLRLVYAIDSTDKSDTDTQGAARKLATAELAVQYAFTAVESTEKPVTAGPPNPCADGCVPGGGNVVCRVDRTETLHRGPGRPWWRGRIAPSR